MSEQQVVENDEANESEKDEEPEDNFIEAINPSGAIREWIVRDLQEGAPIYERLYVQRPLSYFGKIEVFGLLGSTVDRAMKDGMSVQSVLQVGDVFVGGSGSVDAFVGGIARLAMYAPELIMELYCISLAVPRGEREWVKSVWERPELEGGLGDDDGIEILQTFVQQNGEALRDFFTQRMPDAVKGLTEVFADPKERKTGRSEKSPSSKPLKPTQRRTRSR